MRSADASATGRSWLLLAFAVAGVGATALYTSELSPTIGAVSFAVVGVGAVAASYAGPRHFRAEPRTAWRLLTVALLGFLVGVVIRPWAVTLPRPWTLLSDAVLIPAYLVLALFFLLLLRARQSLERHAIIDGLIVCLAGGLLCTLLLAVPSATAGERAGFVPMVSAVFPLLDVLLLLLVVNLTFTATSWSFSLGAVLGTMALMGVGDLAYAILATTGRSYGSPLLDVPFLLAFVLIGLATLHPSVAGLSRPGRPPVQAWSGRRIAVLAPAVAVPFVLLMLVGGRSAGHRIAIAVVGVAMVALLLARAVSAVQAQVAAQLHSEHQANHDPLTGLPNRRMISAQVQRLVAAAPPDDIARVWVYLLDLDGFKWVNESWGHHTGDQLVIEVGARLRSVVPPAAMLARVGGDEFLLAYAGEQAGALRLVDQIRGCFADPFPIGDTEVVISASVGIAHADAAGDPAVTAEALMRDADTAMYRAKAEGPGRSTVFDTSMHDQVRERIELEAALRTAITENQLQVAYQPIVEVDTGRPVGAEALVRWVHPQRGAIPPLSFIPIAEEAGLIATIGAWVREQALTRLAQWRADGTVTDDFYLSINVSPRQLNDPDLPLIVSADLLRHGVPARAVALEMTESVMVDGSSVTARVLFELRELGVRLLIDDFGTGFSALGYLRRFPVTGVKIDRSFVAGLGQNMPDEEIVRAVVAMSHALGLSVVAEGVETRLQRDALAAVGVGQAQGWLWGPAVAPADFAAHWHAGGPAARAAAGVAVTGSDP